MVYRKISLLLTAIVGSIRTRIVMVYQLNKFSSSQTILSIRTRIVMVYHAKECCCETNRNMYSYKNCYGLSTCAYKLFAVIAGIRTRIVMVYQLSAPVSLTECQRIRTRIVMVYL